MAPLSFFRGQGGGADSSSTTTTTTQVPPEAPRTPPPPGEVLTAGRMSPGSASAAGSAAGAAAVSGVAGTGSYTSADQSPSSSSRLNPARLLRRKNSRSLRPPGDRDGRDRSREGGDDARWLGHALGLGHSHRSHSPSSDARKNGYASHANVNGSSAGVGAGVTSNVNAASHPSAGVHGRRPSAGSASMPAPVHAVPSSPSIKPHAASMSLGPPLGSSAGAAASTTSLVTNTHSQQNSLASANPGVSSTHYGSVRSFRSFRSDGASSLPGETETILGPSPNHPLIKGEAGVYHQPFALRPSTPPHGTYPTALSPPPPRRPQRSPIPPPPPRPTHGPPGAPRSRPGTPSSGSSADHADSSSRVPTSRVSERDYGLAAAAAAADEEDVRANTAAWLARKPSGRVKKHTGSSSKIKPERLPRAGSASSANLSHDSFSGDSVDEPASPALSPPSDSFHSPPATFSKKLTPMPPRAEFPSSTALPLGGQRTSFLLPRPRTPERSGYAISVQCVPGADDEVKWEVVLRRTGASKGDAGGATTGEAPAPAGPVSLAAGESIAHTAPPMASSVNLSLALDTDSPSGKLVFITLPSDATPTRTRSRSSASTSASTSSPRVYPSTGGGQAPSTRTAAPPLTFVREDLYPSTGLRDTFVGPPASAPPGQLFPLHGPSVLGPPAPLSAPIAPPSAYTEPLSPRSSAYKRHGAVWASAGGGIPGSPSPARPGIGSPDVFRSPLSSPDRARSTPDRGSFESARQSLEGAVDMI